MYASEYHSKLRNRGISGKHVGVEFLYEHVGTPHGFLTERFPTPKAKCTGKMSVWKIRQNGLAFRMNHPFTEVLNEIHLEVRFTEPNSIRDKKRRRRTTTCDQVL